MAFDPIDRFEDAASFAVALEETGEVATSRRVGEWVKETGARALSERAQRIAAIEGGSSGSAQTVSTDDDTGSQVEMGVAARMSDASLSDKAQTGRALPPLKDPLVIADAITVKAAYAETTRAVDAQPELPAGTRPFKAPEIETTRTASTLIAAPEPARPRWRTLGVLVAFVGLVGIAGVMLFRREPPQEVVSSIGTSSASESSVATTASQPSLDATLARAPQPSALAPPSAAVLPAPVPAVVAPKTASRPTITTTGVPSTDATPPHCVPPFSWVDGVKKYKPECLVYMK